MKGSVPSSTSSPGQDSVNNECPPIKLMLKTAVLYSAELWRKAFLSYQGADPGIASAVFDGLSQGWNSLSEQEKVTAREILLSDEEPDMVSRTTSRHLDYSTNNDPPLAIKTPSRLNLFTLHVTQDF
ncbi:hypothetical protein M231_08029 [Tremella mesenterica]|uniref:Uncharacterized protein n=1 Tax=Tremella mesenterica TaxID=5217 RepID=A0A4V1M2V8_TREME|nr:hypothetical protein M231_08029 [Tremella mesenterica]